MDISREEREELNALCKEIFGVSSKWQKFFRGVPQVVTKKTKEVIPGKDGAEPTTREVDVPVLDTNGAKQYKTKFFTVEEVRTMLLGFKKQIADYKAEMKRQQDEKAAKEAHDKALKQLEQNAQGSAL